MAAPESEPVAAQESEPVEAQESEPVEAQESEPEPVPEIEPVEANEPAARSDERTADDDLGQEHIDPEPVTSEPVDSSSFEAASASAPETDGQPGSEPDEALVDALLAGTAGHGLEEKPVTGTPEPDVSGTPADAAPRLADDPIIELPSPVVPEPSDSPDDSREPRASSDSDEPSETAEQPTRGGPAEA